MKYLKSLDRWHIFVESLRLPILVFFAKIVYLNDDYSGKVVAISLVIYFVTAYVFVFCIKQIVNIIYQIRAEHDEFYVIDPKNFKDLPIVKNKKLGRNELEIKLYPPNYWLEKDKETIRPLNSLFSIWIYVLVFILSVILFVYIPVGKKLYKRLGNFFMVFFYIEFVSVQIIIFLYNVYFCMG